MIENKKSKKKEPNYKYGNQPINMREFNKILDKACKKYKGGKNDK